MTATRRPTDVDLAFQSRALEEVSRTFALTIPQLPTGLREVVANAYLLCRIADTIEDDPQMSLESKRYFADQFVRVLDGECAPMRFSAELYPQLSTQLPAAERDLVLNTPRVVRITHAFAPGQQQPMRRCVRIMSTGMASFQEDASRAGLADMAALDSYCYHVAGVVGEMLTDLFCVHDTRIDAQRARLQSLAVSFGQGLQMTNILKDVWEDYARGACWLPQDLFDRGDFSLLQMSPGTRDPVFVQGYETLVAVARGHLANALEFTLAMPDDQTGIRRFCLWAVGMAVLTLRRIHATPGFRGAAQVKISRRAVAATIQMTNLCVKRDWMLRGMFRTFTHTRPRVRDHEHALSL
ncbi:MAG: farnesyl-diphosphate farnesyltransferase [Gammaproteobacteria bacterium]